MDQEAQLRRYLQVAWQWWWLLLAAMVVAGAGAYLVSVRQQPVYQAAATIMIDEAPGTKDSGDYQSVLSSERRARTYAQLLLTEPLLEAVIGELKLPMTVAELKSMATVQSVRDTQLIKVQVQHGDPAQAATIANTLVTTFGKQTQQLQASRYNASKQSLEAQMAALDQQIKQTEARLEDGERLDGAERDQLESRLDQYRQSYTNLLDGYEQVRLAEAQTTSSIVPVEPAVAPVIPVAPRVLFNTALAALLGLIGAAGSVFLKETLDDRVKSAETLGTQLGLPVLGGIARTRRSSDERPISVVEPRSPVAEAYRTLRTNLQFTSVDRPLHSILVTSPLPHEGKSTVAVNLATVLAQNGRRVLLIDADLRRPVLHKRLPLANRSGLSELFVQPELQLGDAVRSTDIKNVSVLTSGSLPPNPSELVGSEKMADILRQAQHAVDVVIIDAPPLIPVTDAAVLAQRVDGVLLVVRAGQTKLAAAKQAVEQLQHVHAKLVGVVLNDIGTGRLRYGYRYRRYHKYYRYDNEPTLRGVRGWLGRKLKAKHNVDASSS